MEYFTYANYKGEYEELRNEFVKAILVASTVFLKIQFIFWSQALLHTHANAHKI